MTNKKTTLQQISEMIEEYGCNPDTFSQDKVAESVIELVETNHDTTQKLIGKAAFKAYREGIKAVGIWLTDNTQPTQRFIETQTEKVGVREIRIKDIAIMKIKGELPK